MEEILEELKCSLTKSPLKEPYFLDCGHVFEKVAILEYYSL
jgi:hypothetical protein